MQVTKISRSDVYHAHGQLVQHVFRGLEAAANESTTIEEKINRFEDDCEARLRAATPSKQQQDDERLQGQLPLPTEMLSHILSLLDPASVASASSTCFQLYAASCDFVLWKSNVSRYALRGLALDIFPSSNSSSIISWKRAALHLFLHHNRYMEALHILGQLHEAIDDPSSAQVPKISTLAEELATVFASLRMESPWNTRKARARLIQDITSMGSLSSNINFALLPPDQSSLKPLCLQVQIHIIDGFYARMSPLTFSLVFPRTYPIVSEALIKPLSPPDLWSPACDARSGLITLQGPRDGVLHSHGSILSYYIERLTDLFTNPDHLTCDCAI
jgi:hypothetical protein